MAPGLAAAVLWGSTGTAQSFAPAQLSPYWVGALMLHSHALRRICSATAVAFSVAESVTAFALALLVVGERPGPAAYAGLAAVLLRLALVVRTELAASVAQAD